MIHDWITFFRILCHHRQGYRTTMPYELAVSHPKTSDMARSLYMVPLPFGCPLDLSVLASEWRAEKAAEKEAR